MIYGDFNRNDPFKDNTRKLSKMKTKLRNLLNDSQPKNLQITLSSYDQYLFDLIALFSYDTKEGIDLFKEKLKDIKQKKDELTSLGIPILVGFSVMHAETFPIFAEEIWSFLLDEAENDARLSHLIIFNLLTCKHNYKKHIELTRLKSMICEVMNKYNYNETTDGKDNKSNVDIKCYHSLFSTFESFDEFVDKNLLRLDDMKKYVNNGQIQMNQILLNLKKANNITNPKWKHYCSSLNLVNDLILISELLIKCPLKDREKCLNELIMTINKQCLPAKIYDPFANNSDSKSSFLWKINQEYSYPISTKERVPCHILFEYSNTENPNVLSNADISRKYSFKKTEDEFDIKDSQSIISKENGRPSIIIPKITKENSGEGGGLLSYFGFGANSSRVSTLPDESSESLFSSVFSCFNVRKNDLGKNDSDDYNNSSDVSSNPDSIGVFGKKSFKEIQEELLAKSKFKQIKNRYISSVIVKGNDDLRQDYFVSQMIKLFNNIFLENNIDIYLQPLEVLSNGSGGFIQTIVNSTNLMKINKLSFQYDYQDNLSEIPEDVYPGNLKSYFIFKYGRNTPAYFNALNNFISSLAGYSLLCYFLEVKDRNNANILIDDNGNLIHIDYGFLLSRSPGNISFEKAPFKITGDFVNLMQGTSSKYFLQFQQLFEKGYRTLRDRSNLIIAYVSIFSELFSDLPCFKEKEALLTALKQKFCFNKTIDDEIMSHCNSLIFSSINNWRTKAYDQFQKYCVGIN